MEKITRTIHTFNIRHSYSVIGLRLGYSPAQFKYIMNNRIKNNVMIWVLREVIFRCSGNMNNDVIDECYEILDKMINSSGRGGKIIEDMYFSNLISFTNPIISHLVRKYMDENPKGLKLKDRYTKEL